MSGRILVIRGGAIGCAFQLAGPVCRFVTSKQRAGQIPDIDGPCGDALAELLSIHAPEQGMLRARTFSRFSAPQ
jgi:hypothetical protein